MPLLNTASGLYVGSSTVSRVYRGGSLVWEAGGASPGPEPTQMVKKGLGFTSSLSSETLNASLASAPAANSLVLGVVSNNKSSTNYSGSTGWTSRAVHTSTDVSGAVFSASARQNGTFTWDAASSNGGGSAGLYEFNHTSWAFRTSTTSSASAAEVSQVAGTLGNAPAPGVVFAIAGVDSSWTERGPFTGTVSASNGYQIIDTVFQSENADTAGGAAFVLAYKDVAAGDSTAVTISWTGGSDQAYINLVQFDLT